MSYTVKELEEKGIDVDKAIVARKLMFKEFVKVDGHFVPKYNVLEQ